MKDLFDETNLGDLKLQSRVVRTGLWESETKNNKITSDVYDRYESIAKSGVGLITSELISLYPKNKFNEYAHKLYDPNFIGDFRRITDMVHSYNVPILAQLEFVQFNRGIDMNVSVNDLTLDDIRKIQTDLIIAAKKLSFAGFDGIQLALGNNFFLSKFINPYYNQRDDDFGGDTFARLRIVLESIKVIKDNFDLHINCRVNAYDGRKGGIDKEESIKICELLEEYGADSIQVTKPLSPLYFTKDEENNELIDYAVELKKRINLPVIVGGGFDSLDKINNVLNGDDIDFVSMYRPFVAQADFLVDWKKNKNGVSRCKLCNNCYRVKSSNCFHFK
ncbi:NADH-dependent flavin oxidoreductase [Methanosphaera sp. ISO3-F5]|uniref:oxidoreductase n=1 Tax=Methanosphaera sp. ISO3-F5 TaxID=1452353 RepID=UPI002B2591E6|nr:NADH-dependent flavin oxidoreductase [Methanosphaera sp. ISO3-F5]WQH63804.1 NADH-dependent flavin oxidoreductase [Methanosphaera sp. ISO3-F5]